MVEEGEASLNDMAMPAFGEAVVLLGMGRRRAMRDAELGEVVYERLEFFTVVGGA